MVLCCISHTRLTSISHMDMCIYALTQTKIPPCQQANLIKHSLTNGHVLAVIWLVSISRNFFSTPITFTCLCNRACYFLTFNISSHITISYVNNSLNRPQVLKDLLLLWKPGLQWCSLFEQYRVVTSLNCINWIGIMPGIREIMTQGQTELQEGQSSISETSINE